VTTNKKPAPHLKEEFFTHHLPHEIEMFRATYELARAARPAAEHEALLESFLLHARNLIEFFQDRPSCDFDPRMFTAGSYQVNRDFVADTVLPRLNRQIGHLTVKRTTQEADRLGPRDWALILRALEEEIARFTRALSKDYAAKWAPQQPPKTDAPEPVAESNPRSFVLRRANLTAPPRLQDAG
jgi:hypothetical protein